MLRVREKVYEWFPFLDPNRSFHGGVRATLISFLRIYHPFSLRFRDASLEKHFRSSAASRGRRPMQVALLLGFALLAAFGLLDLYLFPEQFVLLWAFRAVACTYTAVAIVVSFNPRLVQHTQVVVAGVISVAALAIMAMMAVARGPLREHYYVGILICHVYGCNFFRLRFPLALLVCVIDTVVYIPLAAWVNADPQLLVNNLAFYLSLTAMGLLGCFAGEHSLRERFRNEVALEAERKRADRARTEAELQRRRAELAWAETDRLLLNLLPAPAVRRIKSGEEVVADAVGSVTVLFADIVGFTTTTEGMAPEDLIDWLNGIFSRIDVLTDKHGLEKIKTIGDAYMLVGGLNTEHENHADAVVELALDLLAMVEHLRARLPRYAQLQFRVGVNTGPVVAGVLGTHRVHYDLWGDTVNVASRMESQGEPGFIQITDATRTAVSDRYVLGPCVRKRIKGLREMDTWLLIGTRDGAPRALPGAVLTPEPEDMT